MMTKKDYKLIADTIAGVRNTYIRREPKRIIDRVVYNLGLVFRENNPRFNTEKFEEACGAQE
jgi:hypothetical protein